jgi:hypothetical protein
VTLPLINECPLSTQNGHSFTHKKTRRQAEILAYAILV